ncbi:MAG TPA: outer-membrane lipoprotein carrier protein LolA [Pyrinomonadaceae bacterium]|nr:outer-membrane lipoprotein carrier protein LolA [Pyrinomonadaceae bacterium]
MKSNKRSRFIRIFPGFIAVFVFAIAATANASGQGIINEILNRMDAHNKALSSLRANVTMVKENAQLGGALDTNEGRVAYLPAKARDPLVRIDWVKPKESLSVVNKQYVIHRPALNQAYTGTTDGAKGNAKAGTALAFMNMSRAQLKENYTVAYLGEETVKDGTKTWHLQMTPKVPTSYKSAEVWVDGNGMPVQSKVIEKNNDTTTVLLTNLQKNVRVDKSEFQIKLPDGTKVIKS